MRKQITRRSMNAGMIATFAAPVLSSRSYGADGAVKIGLLMTYSGQFADPATQMDNGIKLRRSSILRPATVSPCSFM
jgi:hypothetical protein